MPAPVTADNPAPACASCGYPLAELDGGLACPECGTPASLSAVLGARRIPPGPAARRIVSGYAWIAGANAAALPVALLVLAAPDVPAGALAPLAGLFAVATGANALGWTRVARGVSEAWGPLGPIANVNASAKGLRRLTLITAILNWCAAAFYVLLAGMLIATPGSPRDAAALAAPLALLHLAKAIPAWAALHRVAMHFGARFERSPWPIVVLHALGVLGSWVLPPLAALGWAAYTLRAIRMAADLRAPA